ncbi:MAG: hypothetical protein H0V17_11305 [Deltaproteobacteria bacterium]|nr:hypothetical protein [Deltaproteobacteria bacterium]
MLKLLFASLLTASSTLATADTAPKPALLPSNTCLVTPVATTPLFQIETNGLGQIKGHVDTRMAIQSNGAWTYTQTKAGKVQRTEVGCLSRVQLATLKSALASATWKTSQAQGHCEAIAMDYKEYSYLGNPMLRTELCDGQIIDNATRKAIADARAITNKLVK